MKINKSDLEKLIQETFESLYEDSDDKNFFDSNDNNNSLAYKNVGSAINIISANFSDVTLGKLNSEIDAIIQNGKGVLNLNYGKSVDKGLTSDFDYVVSVLAGLYKTSYNNIADKKNNIITYLFYAFYPVPIAGINTNKNFSDNRERLNQFGHAVATKAKVFKDLTFSNKNDVMFFIDAIKDSVRDALMYCLNKFDPDRGTFSKMVMVKSSQNLQDDMRNKNAFQDLKSSSYSKEYLDDPIGSDDNEKKSSFLSADHSNIDDILKQKNSSIVPFKSKQEAIDKYIRIVLKKNKKDNFLQLYELEQKELSQKEIAEIMGISHEGVRQLKFRLQSYLNDNFVETNRMQNFLKVNGFDDFIPKPFNLSNKKSSWEPKQSSEDSFKSPEDTWKGYEFSAPKTLKESIINLIRKIIYENK